MPLTYLWNRFLAFGERRYVEVFGDVPAIPAEMRRGPQSIAGGAGDRASEAAPRTGHVWGHDGGATK
jgi:hypothetical protein